MLDNLTNLQIKDREFFQDEITSAKKDFRLSLELSMRALNVQLDSMKNELITINKSIHLDDVKNELISLNIAIKELQQDIKRGRE